MTVRENVVINVVFLIIVCMGEFRDDKRANSSTALNACKQQYPASCSLAHLALEPFRASGISWEMMKQHKGKFLAIDHRKRILRWIHPINYTEPSSWFHDRDAKRVQELISEEPLPSILMPFNRKDSSDSRSDVLQKYPIISFCQKLENIDILWPSSQSFGDRVLKEKVQEKWISKNNQAWFRGSGNAGLMKGRFSIINESLSIPDLVDAKLTDSTCFQTKKILYKDMLRPLCGNKTDLVEAVRKFRYIIDLDGNCAAMRLQSLLGKNVVVVKPRSTERQWFSSVLQPWIHYLPLYLRPYEIPEAELVGAFKEKRPIRQRSDLKQVMEWAVAHPNHTFQIMRSANLFHKDYLSPAAVKCYIRCLVHEIAKLTTFNVTSQIDRLMMSTT